MVGSFITLTASSTVVFSLGAISDMYSNVIT